MGNQTIAKSLKGLQDECIRVPKVYDWVTAALTKKIELCFSERQLEEIEDALTDPYRRPLRLVVKTPKTPPLFPLGGKESDKDEHKDFFCEQVGEKRQVTVFVNGEYVEAELVDLLFTANIEIKVVDRQGTVVTKLVTDVSVLEPFVLSFPDGTDLLCRVSKIWARLFSGSMILNGPCPDTVRLAVTFCVDVQVEAEVKLEVMARFCAPRGPIEAPESDDLQCPDIEFPEQRPSIFPGKSCAGKAVGAASGPVGDECEAEGVAGVNVSICANGRLDGSTFDFTFDDQDGSDGLKDFQFHAKSFEPESLESFEKDGFTFLKVAGEGKTENGKKLDFMLDLADRNGETKFRVKLIDDWKGKVVFDTGLVEASEGSIDVETC